MKTYAEKKVKKFYKHHPKITKITVEMNSETAHRGKETDYLVDITVIVPRHTLTIRDSERDMYKAIDKACDRMIRALTKEKEKHETQRNKANSPNP